MKPIKPTEGYQRSSHPDFADTAELVKMQFSGQRVNSISGYYEIWIKGKIRKELSAAQIEANPMAVTEAIAEVFALDHVAPDTAEARNFYSNQSKH